MAKTDTKISLKRVVLPPGKLLVREVPPETKSPGGIILPAAGRAARCIAVVLKMGKAPLPGSVDDAGIHSDLKLGHEVIVGAFSMQENSQKEEFGEGVHTVNETDVLAIILPEKGKKK